MNLAPIILICDIRQPWPHPWRQHLPPQVRLQRAKLPFGDFVLAGNDTGFVLVRRTLSDLLSCRDSEREQFERELAHAAKVRPVSILIEADSHRLGLGREVLGALVTRTHCAGFMTFDPCNAAMYALQMLAGQLSPYPETDAASNQRERSRPTRVADSRLTQSDWEESYGIGWYRARVTPAKRESTKIQVTLLDEQNIAFDSNEGAICITDRARALFDATGGEMVVELRVDMIAGKKRHLEHSGIIKSGGFHNSKMLVATIAADLADIKSPTKPLVLEYEKDRLVPGTWLPARIIPDAHGGYSYQPRAGIVIAIKNSGSWSTIDDGRSDEELANCDICKRAVATQQTQLALARVAQPSLSEDEDGVRRWHWTIDALKLADNLPVREFATGTYLITKRRLKDTGDHYKLFYIRAGSSTVSCGTWGHRGIDIEVIRKRFEDMGYVNRPELEAELEADGFWEKDCAGIRSSSESGVGNSEVD